MRRRPTGDVTADLDTHAVHETECVTIGTWSLPLTDDLVDQWSDIPLGTSSVKVSLLSHCFTLWRDGIHANECSDCGGRIEEFACFSPRVGSWRWSHSVDILLSPRVDVNFVRVKVRFFKVQETCLFVCHNPSVCPIDIIFAKGNLEKKLDRGQVHSVPDIVG